MNPPNSVEKRLEKVEDELRQIKQRLDGKNKGSWISRMRGQFDNDPVFDEIVRLGKEIRDAELPPDADKATDSYPMFLFDSDHLSLLQRNDSVDGSLETR